MRIIFIVILFTVFANLSAQPLRTGYNEFIDYSTIVKDIENNGKKSIYYNYSVFYEMRNIDNSTYKVFFKVNPKYLIEENIDTSISSTNAKDPLIYKFDLKSNNIKDFFNNKTLFYNSIDKIVESKNWTMDNKIFIKDNKIAVFTVSKQTWSGTYKAVIINNKVNIELLHQTQE